MRAKEKNGFEVVRDEGGMEGDIIWVVEAFQEAEDLSKKEGGGK